MTGNLETNAPETAHQLRTVLGKLVRRLRDKSASEDLTWSQRSALLHLEQEGSATIATLARLEGVRPQSMGATVATLEAAELVEGAPDPNDKRRTLMALTPACVDMLRVRRAAKEDWLLQALRSRLTDDEQRALADAVRLLALLVD